VYAETRLPSNGGHPPRTLPSGQGDANLDGQKATKCSREGLGRQGWAIVCLSALSGERAGQRKGMGWGKGVQEQQTLQLIWASIGGCRAQNPSSTREQNSDSRNTQAPMASGWEGWPAIGLQPITGSQANNLTLLLTARLKPKGAHGVHWNSQHPRPCRPNGPQSTRMRGWVLGPAAAKHLIITGTVAVLPCPTHIHHATMYVHASWAYPGFNTHVFLSFS
jgi:hypothetical protein